MPQPLSSGHQAIVRSSHEVWLYGKRKLAIPPPAIATRLFAYSYTLAPIGGKGPYTFAIHSGALPTGLSMSSSGVISGTGTEDFDPSLPPCDSSGLKHYHPVVRVTDSRSNQTDCVLDFRYQMAVHIGGSLTYSAEATAANPAWVAAGWTLTTPVDAIAILHQFAGLILPQMIFEYSPNIHGFHDTFSLQAGSPGIWIASPVVNVVIGGAIEAFLSYASEPQSPGPLGTYSVALPAGAIDDSSHGGGIYAYSEASGSFVIT